MQDFRDRLWDLGYNGLEGDGAYYGFSLALGSAEVTLLEQANAYRTLANGGRWSALKLRAGDAGSDPRHVIDPAAAWIVGDILSDPSARAGTFGVDSALRLPFWSAAKTGTSKGMRDNWCIGYSDRFTVAVWVGNLEGDSMRSVSGTSGAAPVWRDVMLAHAASIGEEIEDRELIDFPVAAMDVVLTTRSLADRTLGEVATLHGRGVMLMKLVRGGEEIPFTADTVLNRGDLLRIVDEQIMDSFVEVRIGVRPTDELHLRRKVRLFVEQHTVGWPAVSPRAADLLIPRFHRAGDFGVDDETNVLLVDPHAKRGRRQHERAATLHELVLNASSLLAVEVAVIIHMRHALLAQQFAEAFERADQREVDDPAPRSSRMPFTHGGDLRELLVVAPDLFNRESQVRPIDPLVIELDLIRPQPELPDDVGLNFGRGRRGEGDRGRVAEQRPELAEPCVVGAKVVAPLTDTVSLIDGEQPHIATANRLNELRFAKPLRRDVQQRVPPLSNARVTPHTLLT